MSSTNGAIVKVYGKKILCGCSDEQKMLPLHHTKQRKPCPNPKGEVDLGELNVTWLTRAIRKILPGISK